MDSHAAIRRADAAPGHECLLLSTLRIGRAADCHLVLTDAQVSHEHATLRYVGGTEWVLRDLGSKNGTFVNRRRVGPGDTRLASGDELWFGDKRAAWTFQAGRPCDLIVITGEQTEWMAASHGDGLLALPSAEAPDATLLYRSGDWVVEAPDCDSVVLSNGQRFTSAGERRRVWFSNDTEPTQETQGLARSLDDFVLYLAVSRDEEQVEGELRTSGGRVALPARVYLYLLVVLGRYHHEDLARGMAPNETGWRYADDVSRSLGVDLQTLNVQVHRARQDIAKLGFADPASLIERRAMSKQLRLGIPPDRVVLTTL